MRMMPNCPRCGQLLPTIRTLMGVEITCSRCQSHLKVRKRRGMLLLLVMPWFMLKILHLLEASGWFRGPALITAAAACFVLWLPLYFFTVRYRLNGK
jgi:hypothetical protein